MTPAIPKHIGATLRHRLHALAVGESLIVPWSDHPVARLTIKRLRGTSVRVELREAWERTPVVLELRRVA